MPGQQPTRTKLILAGVAGNVLEWYDFAVYGYFALIIGKHFFPSDDPINSLIASFGAFAAGFFMRPLGSLLFGHIGDTRGRKAALTISILLMAGPTFLIGLLPTYETIGILAPLLLVLLRMMQGASVGGEYTTSITFLAEGSAAERRGLTSSWSSCGAVLGVLLGSAVGAVISNILSEDALTSWGWRIPFLIGILIMVVGYYLRRNMEDQATQVEREESPLKTTVQHHWKDLLRISCLVFGYGIGFYIIFVYAATWLPEFVGVSKARALDINTANMALMVLVILLSAYISDRIGRKPILIASLGGLTLFSYGLFWMMHHNSDAMVFSGQLGFTILIGMAGGVMPALLAELSPAHVRVTVMSVGYNLTFGLFGGTAPMAAAFLIKTTHMDLSPAIYLSIAAAVSLCAAFTVKETAGIDLLDVGQDSRNSD